MILKLLKLKIKELRGCPRALNLIDEYVGNRLDFSMDEFHKVIHFFEKCVQFLILKEHTHKIYEIEVRSYLNDKTCHQYKTGYMNIISYCCSSLIPISKYMDKIDHINILNGQLNDRIDLILTHTYLYYTILFKQNTYGKKTSNAPYRRNPTLDMYYDTYKVKCKLCNSYECKD
jgi:hypothetical protein